MRALNLHLMLQVFFIPDTTQNLGLNLLCQPHNNPIRNVEEKHTKDFKNLNFPGVESSYDTKDTTLTQNDQKGTTNKPS